MTLPDPATVAAQGSACAHLHIRHVTVSAGPVFIEETADFPGGLHETFKDCWRCDTCHAEFVPATALLADRQRTRQETLQEAAKVADDYTCGCNCNFTECYQAGPAILDLRDGRGT